MLKGCKRVLKKYGRTNSSQVSLNLEQRRKTSVISMLLVTDLPFPRLPDGGRGFGVASWYNSDFQMEVGGEDTR